MEYVAAVQSDICTTCTEQDAEGHCRLRQKGDCALTVYMPLVVEAIEEVNAAWWKPAEAERTPPSLP